MTNHGLMIDQEVKARLFPIPSEELKLLEDSIKREGCRDPLVLWKGMLADGHHRYEICEQLGVPFKTVELEWIESKEELLDWIDANQLGRRNLTPRQTSLLRGRRYNYLKRQGKRNDLTSAQNERKLHSDEQLASQYGVSPVTIRRDGVFAKAVEAAEVNPESKALLMNGRMTEGSFDDSCLKEIRKSERKSRSDRASQHLKRKADKEEFEQQVESDNPPTVTALAEQGIQKRPATVNAVLLEDFKEATKVLNAVFSFCRYTKNVDFDSASLGLRAKEKSNLRKKIALAQDRLTALNNALEHATKDCSFSGVHEDGSPIVYKRLWWNNLR